MIHEVNCVEFQSGVVPQGSFGILPIDILEDADGITISHISYRNINKNEVFMPIEMKEKRQLQQKLIRTLMKPLSCEERKVLYLKFIRQWSDKLIARKLKCSPLAIPMKIASAILKINQPSVGCS